MSNEVLQTIAERFSCRSYTGAPVERSKIEAIVKAGLHSPSAVDQQKWRLKVVTNKQLVDDMSAEALDIMKNMEDKAFYERIMSRGGVPFYNAPALILIMKTESNINPDLDCGIMVQNMALAATSVGYNSVIAAMSGMPLSGPRGDEFKQRLNIADGETFAIGLLLGEGNMTKEPHAIDWDKVSYID